MGMQGQMMFMLKNIMLWAHDPAVLHLSMDHLRTNFNRTMACMNRFLGTRGLPLAMLPSLSALDASEGNATSEGHVTSGKHDNSGLEEMLLQEPIWGAEFKE